MQWTERCFDKLPGWLRIRAALPISAILLIGALARTWQLSQNEFGRQYYAAAVRGMMDSWPNFLFNAFDAAGFVSIDKPPVAIWLQALSAKLLGFSGMSILLAQVIAGLIAIALTYHLVQRTFGRTAAIWAALVLALTPVSIAVDRSNNTESCLIAVLLLAAWLAMKAAETGRFAWLCGAMALAGVGFNIKMGAALVLVPVFAVTFSLASAARPVTWHLTRQAIAACVLIAVSLSWVTFFDLTPPSERPYAGSTKQNSMLELALKHNGTDRFLRPPVAEPAAVAKVAPDTTDVTNAAAAQPVLYDDSPTGLLRLFRPRAATQVAWLLPLALAGLVLAWLAPVRDGALASRRIGAGVWTGWLFGYWLVLSFAGGPVHTYYVAILGPPLAVFSGIAVADLWARWQAGTLPRWAIPLLTLALVAWQGFLFVAQDGAVGSSWLWWTWVTSIGVALAAGTHLLTLAQRNGKSARLTVAAGLAAFFVLPSLTAASVVVRRPNVAAPVADLSALLKEPDTRADTLRRLRQNAARQKLTNYLIDNRGSATYLVAVPNANVAAPLILATGLPVMAMGGYLGDDPILTPQALERLVAEGQLRFVMLGGFTLTPGKGAALDPIAQWVRANGRVVDPLRWSIYRSRNSAPYHIRLGDQWFAVPPPELFDLHPS